MTSTHSQASPSFRLAIFTSIAWSGAFFAASANGLAWGTVLPSVSSELGDTLSQQATISWQEVPLREALTRLGTTFDLSWFMDRRIDPRQLVSLRANQLSIAAMLDEFAEQNGLSVTLLGRVIYFGPPEGAAELLESWQRQGGADSSKTKVRPSTRLRKALSKKDTTDWPHLTEPRRLIEQILSESRIKVEGTDLIPHDLWATGSLPELSMRDRLALLLIGFELDWQFDTKGRSLVIVSSRHESETSDVVPKLVDQIATKKSSPSTNHSNEQRYSLRIESQPLRAVLSQIAKSAKRTLVIEADAKPLIDQRVSISVEKVTLEELVDELAKAARLSAEFTEDKIVIRSR